jgi:hypothetical protein
MKKILLTTTLSMVSLCSFLFLSANNTNKKAAPYATFDKLWIDYDVYENDVKGMKIHVKFTVYEMLNIDGYLAIYFKYDDEDGVYLKDKNDKYSSTSDEVAVYKSIKPLYNPAVYNDLSVFMPYNELELDPGEYDLAMDVKLIYKEGGTITKLTTHYFEYTKPGATTTTGGAPATKITATFKDMWVDYDVYENGKKGMRIHTKFTVENMKGTDGYLALYFEKENGERLKSEAKGYSSSTGQLAVYALITPGYDKTDYNDMTAFIPYSEFDLPAGKNDLKIDADIIYKAGGMIQHLKYYDFWMTK